MALLKSVPRDKTAAGALADVLTGPRRPPRGGGPAIVGVDFQSKLIDPLEYPPDAKLVRQYGALSSIRHGILPWRKIGGRTVVLAVSEDRFEQHRPALAAMFGELRFGIVQERRLQSCVQRLADTELVNHAESRTPLTESCRNFDGRAAMFALVFLGLLLLTSGYFAPRTLIIVLSTFATVFAITNSALKLAAAVAETLSPDRQDPPLPAGAELPTISILVPLYREELIASHLLARLQMLNYPRDKMDILLAVERDDKVTRDTLSRTDLPAWIRPIIVPPGGCKTKPRALNYALDFTRGEIVGVYDAEDAPEPNQLLIVARRFATCDEDVACLQGILDFYNAGSNWLARCFTVEYAAWFRVVLPGLQRLGLVIPLGGTTLFFRRAVLEKLGGWDAHNVTEDADLGIRLARHGYRTEMIPTVTFEEANARLWPWIKQRSRWLKGYAITYWVHMRRPFRLWRDLGARRFLGLQIQFGATLGGILLIPILWSFWISLLGYPHPFMDALGFYGVWTVALLFLLSEVLNISISALGVARSQRPELLKWTPSLHFYYPLAAFASYKGFWEIATQPFYWDKTAHGIFAPTQPEPDPTADA